MALEKNEYKFPDEVEDKGKNETKAESEDDIIVEMEADSENEVDVEVVDDTPPRDRNRKPSEPPTEVTEDELKEYSDKVRKRIQHFSKGYHDERRAKEAALKEREELERLTAHLAEENKKLKSTVNKNQEVLLEQAKKEIASEVETAKRAYKQAYESGDADAVVEAQEALTTAKLKSDKVESFKFDPVEEELEAQPPARPPVDPRAMEWAKDNPWFGKDDEMTSYVLGLHNKLVKDRVDPKSDEYYEIIDSRMRKLFSDRFESESEDGEQETAPKPRRKANVVAPATRSTAPKKIVLNPRQVALAKKYGIPLQQYAQEVAKLGREQ
jgi:hypothetical protein